MPRYLAENFRSLNDAIQSMHDNAARYASTFTADPPREEIAKCHRALRDVGAIVAAERGVPGVDAFAKQQWNQPAMDFSAKMTAVLGDAAACTDWIAANFPTVLSTLNAAMTTAGLTNGQQNSVRTAMGSNLDYLLSYKFVGASIQSPTIPAATLAPLVTLLNALAAETDF